MQKVKTKKGKTNETALHTLQPTDTVLLEQSYFEANVDKFTSSGLVTEKIIDIILDIVASEATNKKLFTIV